MSQGQEAPVLTSEVLHRGASHFKTRGGKRYVDSMKRALQSDNRYHSSTRSLEVAVVGVVPFLFFVVAVLTAILIVQLELSARALPLACFLAGTAHHDTLAQGEWDVEAVVEVVVPNLEARFGCPLVLTRILLHSQHLASSTEHRSQK